MKRGTPNHPKTTDLITRLNIPRAYGVGLLEMLWQFTAQYAPAGDIGKFSDDAIAKGAGWDGDPSAFVAALVAATLCNVHDGYRIIVHDWPDHCEDGVHTYLALRGLMFADGTKPNIRKLNQQQRKRVPSEFHLPPVANVAATSGNVAAISAVTPCPLPLAPSPLPLAVSLRSSSTGVEGKGEKSSDRDIEIYKAYPRHVGKRDALKAILAARKRLHAEGNPHPGEYLLAQVKAYAAIRLEVEGPPYTHTPHPASWFNKGRYEDDPGEWRIVYNEQRPPVPVVQQTFQQQRMAIQEENLRKAREMFHDRH